MKHKNLIFAFFLSIFVYSTLIGQVNSVTIEAESGTLGSDFRVLDTLGVKCVIIKTNLINGSYPGNDNRVITFNVTFPGAGTYDLYAHILVGKNTYDDDSYFLAKGFGTKNITLQSDWILVNGLASGGSTASNLVVDEAGGAQNLVWKWLNVSKFVGATLTDNYVIAEGALTQTYQIGAREDGLYIDKLVFGKRGYYYKGSDLDNGKPGSKTPPGALPIGIPIAAGKTKFLGCAFDKVQKTQFQGYWNQVTPGNAGKWGSVEGTRGSWNWTELDSAYNFAKRYNFIFKEHTLLWGSQQPSWMNGLDSANQRQEIEKWFSLLASRYDNIDFIDVVNEPIHNAPDGMIPWGTTTPNINYAKALGGKGKTGWDWIITSFRLARKYFPKSKLILNEYSLINDANATRTFVEIVKLLKAENLIDGIGEQGHAFTTYGTTNSTMTSNLDLLAATGIPIYITELDIDGLDDYVQMQEFQRVFKLLWEHPAVQGITLWGFRYGVWRNAQGAYLINENGEERPALKWLEAYVNDTLTLAKSIAISGKTSLNKVGDSTKLVAKILPINTLFPIVTWSISPKNIAKIGQDGMLTALADGKVTVKASAIDGSGVTGTLDITITNNTTVDPTGISDKLTNENISVYPNPSKDGNFKITGIEKLKRIEVMDLTGRKVKEYAVLSQSSLNIQIQTNGIYLLRFFDGQMFGYKKVIVE